MLVLTGVLVSNTLLPHVETFARGIGPPLFKLAVLIIKPASRVKGMLHVGFLRKLGRWSNRANGLPLTHVRRCVQRSHKRGMWA
jgi:hypothetical protein